MFTAQAFITSLEPAKAKNYDPKPVTSGGRS
jgi:hypothetical protein